MDLAVLDKLDSRDLRRARKRLRRLARRGPREAAAFARRNGGAAVDATADRIRAHPLIAAAVLFGAGLAVGALVRGARR